MDRFRLLLICNYSAFSDVLYSFFFGLTGARVEERCFVWLDELWSLDAYKVQMTSLLHPSACANLKRSHLSSPHLI